jgi:hypothetical protein
MLSINISLIVAALSFLTGLTQVQAATPIVAPKGAKVLTVGVIGGDNSDFVIEFIADRSYRLWLDWLGPVSRSILLGCAAYFASLKYVPPQRGRKRQVTPQLSCKPTSHIV